MAWRKPPRSLESRSGSRVRPGGVLVDAFFFIILFLVFALRHSFQHDPGLSTAGSAPQFERAWEHQAGAGSQAWFDADSPGVFLVEPEAEGLKWKEIDAAGRETAVGVFPRGAGTFKAQGSQVAIWDPGPGRLDLFEKGEHQWMVQYQASIAALYLSRYGTLINYQEANPEAGASAHEGPREGLLFLDPGGKRMWEKNLQKGVFLTAAFSPGGTRVAVSILPDPGSEVTQVVVYDLAGSEIYEYFHYGGLVQGLVFSSEASLVLASAGEVVKLGPGGEVEWSLRTEAWIRDLVPKPGSGLIALGLSFPSLLARFLPVHRGAVAVITPGGKVLWRRDTPGEVRDLAWTGDHLAVGTDKGLTLYGPRGQGYTLEGMGPVLRVVSGPGGDYLLVEEARGQILLLRKKGLEPG